MGAKNGVVLGGKQLRDAFPAPPAVPGAMYRDEVPYRLMSYSIELQGHDDRGDNDLEAIAGPLKMRADATTSTALLRSFTVLTDFVANTICD